MTCPVNELASLSDFVDIKHGFAFESEFFDESGDHLLLTPGNFNERGGFRDLGTAQKRYSGPVPPSFILKKGDVLVAMTEQSPGLLGSTIKIPRDDTYLHNQRLGLITVKRPECMFIGYLYHLFNAPHVRKAISANSSGSKVKHTSPTKLCSVVTFIASLKEQKRVATLLDEWDTAIEKTERLIVAKEGYYTHELSRLISQGHHPRNHVGNFAHEVSERNRGGNDERVLSVTNSRGFVLPEDQFERRVASADLSNYKVVRRGQYAYNPSRINVGSIARLDGWDDGVLSPMYVVFGLDKSKVDSDYFLHWLDSHEARERIKKSAQGSVRETVSFTEFAAIAFPFPDISAQSAIASYLNALREEILVIGVYATKLKEQKRGLMQKLLTGQWRVKVPEIEVA